MKGPRAERRGVFSFCSEVLEPGRQELFGDKALFYASAGPANELLESWLSKLL